MIEVEVNNIRASLINQQRVLLLKELYADRYLPIWIGQPEADAITLELQGGRQPKRPMTHDLLKNVLMELSARVVHILVNDIRNDTFYARLVLEVDGQQREIDCRPSDAIALAVRVKAPIFVSEAVMEKSGIEPEEEVDMDAESFFASTRDEDVDEDDTPDEAAVPDEDEGVDDVDESQFSAFADFMNTLNLDELDDNDE